MRGDWMVTALWQSKNFLPISFLVSFLWKKPSISSWVHSHTEYRLHFSPSSSNRCDHCEQRNISKMSLVISLKRGVKLFFFLFFFLLARMQIWQNELEQSSWTLQWKHVSKIELQERSLVPDAHGTTTPLLACFPVNVVYMKERNICPLHLSYSYSGFSVIYRWASSLLIQKVMSEWQNYGWFLFPSL